MEIKDLREEIDAIDSAMVQLFRQRMNVAAKVAAYKKENDGLLNC